MNYTMGRVLELLTFALNPQQQHPTSSVLCSSHSKSRPLRKTIFSPQMSISFDTLDLWIFILLTWYTTLSLCLTLNFLFPLLQRWRSLLRVRHSRPNLSSKTKDSQTWSTMSVQSYVSWQNMNQSHSFMIRTIFATMVLPSDRLNQVTVKISISPSTLNQDILSMGTVWILFFHQICHCSHVCTYHLLLMGWMMDQLLVSCDPNPFYINMFISMIIIFAFAVAFSEMLSSQHPSTFTSFS